jgi:hypothetical protein
MNEHIDPTCLVAGRICQLGAVLFLRDIGHDCSEPIPGAAIGSEARQDVGPSIGGDNDVVVRKESIGDYRPHSSGCTGDHHYSTRSHDASFMIRRGSAARRNDAMWSSA